MRSVPSAALSHEAIETMVPQRSVIGVLNPTAPIKGGFGLIPARSQWCDETTPFGCGRNRSFCKCVSQLRVVCWRPRARVKWKKHGSVQVVFNLPDYRCSTNLHNTSGKKDWAKMGWACSDGENWATPKPNNL